MSNNSDAENYPSTYNKYNNQCSERGYQILKNWKVSSKFSERINKSKR